MQIQEYTTILEKHIPVQAAPVIAKWILDTHCLFTISRRRSSKFGDYRPPYQGSGHRISVNHNLNPYAFLVTTVHEFAHLKTWQEHQSLERPHGAAWKKNFKELMGYFFERQVFPDDIQQAVIRYLDNPAASSCTDLNLFRVLQRYDKPRENVHTVEQLPGETIFALKDGRVFRKGPKLRKRYRCTEVATNRIYLFSPVAEVFVVSKTP